MYLFYRGLRFAGMGFLTHIWVFDLSFFLWWPIIQMCGQERLLIHSSLFHVVLMLLTCTRLLSPASFRLRGLLVHCPIRMIRLNLWTWTTCTWHLETLGWTASRLMVVRTIQSMLPRRVLFKETAWGISTLEENRSFQLYQAARCWWDRWRSATKWVLFSVRYGVTDSDCVLPGFVFFLCFLSFLFSQNNLGI